MPFDNKKLDPAIVEAGTEAVQMAVALLRQLPKRKRLARLAQETTADADALWTVAGRLQRCYTAEEWSAVLASIDASPLTVHEWLDTIGQPS